MFTMNFDVFLKSIKKICGVFILLHKTEFVILFAEGDVSDLYYSIIWSVEMSYGKSPGCSVHVISDNNPLFYILHLSE